MTHFLSRLMVALAVCVAFSTAASAAGTASPQTATPAGVASSSRAGDFFASLLPVAWQKRPTVVFNAITEMTPEGKKRRVPTPQQPMYYYLPSAQFAQRGDVPAGETPPSTASLEEAMRKALATNGYLPVSPEHPRPDVLIVLDFGSHGSLLPSIDSARDAIGQLIDPRRALNSAQVDLPIRLEDVVERARFLGGDKFALDFLNTVRFDQAVGRAPRGAPFYMFMQSYDADVVEHFIEIAFHSIYYVRATAFDFGGVAQKQKVPLWQSRMSIEAQGVSMEEILKPLIVQTASFLGRETPEPLWITRRVDREGKVEIGQAQVVPGT